MKEKERDEEKQTKISLCHLTFSRKNWPSCLMLASFSNTSKGEYKDSDVKRERERDKNGRRKELKRVEKDTQKMKLLEIDFGTGETAKEGPYHVV